jgi:hypothetical protein
MSEWNNQTFLEKFVEYSEGRKARHSNAYIHRFDGVDFFLQQQKNRDVHIVAIRYNSPKLILFDNMGMRKYLDRLRSSALDKNEFKHWAPLNAIEGNVPDITKTEILEEVNGNYLIRFDNLFFLFFWKPRPGKLTKDQFRQQVMDYDQSGYSSAVKQYIQLSGPEVHIRDAVESLIPEEDSYYVNGVWLTDEGPDFKAPKLEEEAEAIFHEGCPVPEHFGITHPTMVSEAKQIKLETLEAAPEPDDAEELFLRVHYKDALRAYVQAREAWAAVAHMNKTMTVKARSVDEILKPLWVDPEMEPVRTTQASILPAENNWQRDTVKLESVYIKGMWGLELSLPHEDKCSILELRLENWTRLTSGQGKTSYTTSRR